MCDLGADEPDERLAGHARQGCPDCFGRLYSRCRGLISRYVSEAFFRNLDDALEVEDETWKKALEHLPSYGGSRPFRAWLFAIARNHALNRLRRRGELPGGTFAAAGPSPLEELERRETARRCARLVSALPAELREPFYLRTVAGLGIQMISELLSVSPTTIKGRLFRARKALVESARQYEEAP